MGASVKKTRATLAAVVVLALGAALASLLPATGATAAAPTGVAPVLFVGNNWDGTADVIRQGGTANQPTFTRVARLNIIPDINERMLEIATDPVRLAYFLAIRQAIGEGHDQFVDDMFASQGRPAAGRLAAEPRRRHRARPQHRRDRLALPRRWPALRPHGDVSRWQLASPSRPRPATSSTSSTRSRARRSGRFPSGDSPHENNYSADGQRIFHASIGLVYTPADQPRVRHHEGRSPLPDRRREHEPDHRADRHGPEARGGRLSRT